MRAHPERLAANERVWEAAKAISAVQGEWERAAARTRYLDAIVELRKVEAELARRYQEGERAPE